MRSRISLLALALTATFVCPVLPLSSQANDSPPLRVLAREKGGFNVSTVKALMEKGDLAVSKGNLAAARKHFDKARDVSKQLLSFYRDIGGSFRGLDARIPREMDAKGRKTLTLLADANLRLAAIFRKQNKPEVAVPLLIEVVRLMTPAKSQGQEAYQNLLELGFVDTNYGGAR